MQEREPIWDNRTGKGFLTDFRTDIHRKRQPQKQNCKRRKKRMTHPLGDTHPSQLLPGQANRAQDTVLPLPGHLVGKRRIDQIDSAKQEDQPGKSLQASKYNAALHFLIFDMCGYAIHSKIAAAGYQLLYPTILPSSILTIRSDCPGFQSAGIRYQHLQLLPFLVHLPPFFHASSQALAHRPQRRPGRPKNIYLQTTKKQPLAKPKYQSPQYGCFSS